MALLKNQATPLSLDQESTLRSAFDTYNTYRGDLEQARTDANNRFDTEIKEQKALLTSQGNSPYGRQWNNSLAEVERVREERLQEANKVVDDYKKSSDYSSLYNAYEDRVLKNKDQARSFTQRQLAIDTQGSDLTPSFDEFVDLEFGSDQQRTAAQDVLTMRRRNEMRAI